MELYERGALLVSFRSCGYGVLMTLMRDGSLKKAAGRNFVTISKVKLIPFVKMFYQVSLTDSITA